MPVVHFNEQIRRLRRKSFLFVLIKATYIKLEIKLMVGSTLRQETIKAIKSGERQKCLLQETVCHKMAALHQSRFAQTLSKTLVNSPRAAVVKAILYQNTLSCHEFCCVRHVTQQKFLFLVKHTDHRQ